ncbi:unnamed protein product [Orchesella dallaii]|uniref:Uncharacterized protein n=1 Tax=Orchesella dallaii TaxID=48710 RepID=A0ABP1Q9U1_9HEXA
MGSFNFAMTFCSFSHATQSAGKRGFVTRKMHHVPTAYVLLLVMSSHFILLSFSLPEDSDNRKDNLHFVAGHEFVSGKSVEYLPDPIFYDTYIPILFKIPVPRHTEIALKLIWGDVQSCSKTKTGNLCPIAYHLFKVIKRLGDDMGFWKPFYINHTATRKESQKRRAGFEVICNEIGPHFFRSYTSQAQLDGYVKAIRACSRFGSTLPYHKPNESWVVDKAVYYRMLESYKDEYFDHLPQQGKVDWAITMNTYGAVHGLLLTNHVMESVRLATALRICQSGLIPETFVSMDMLRQQLKSVPKSLGRWNYQLVYNNLEEDIEEYYKLPLADCSFSDEYSFIIRILVPVKRSELYHRLVEITTIPFLEKLSNTSGMPERLCSLKLPASKLRLIETSTGLLLDTQCEPNQLCKTSEVSTVFENDACTLAVLTDNRQLITTTCKFFCFTVDASALPLIRRINSDTYILVGSSDTKIHINCFNKPSDLIPISMKNMGALRIKLACNCHLLYSNFVSYRPREPCGAKTVVEHILPYHWYTHKLNSTLDKYEHPIENDIIEGVANITSTNDSLIIPPPNNSGQELTEKYEIEDEQIEKSVAKQEEELGNEFRSKPQPRIVYQRVHEMSGGLVVQLCILWILVVVLAATTFVLGYHVYKLKKWRELQAYKDTRIVYSIPKTPDENKINGIRTASGGTRVAWDAFYDLFTVH